MSITNARAELVCPTGSDFLAELHESSRQIELRLKILEAERQGRALAIYHLDGKVREGFINLDEDHAVIMKFNRKVERLLISELRGVSSINSLQSEFRAFEASIVVEGKELLDDAEWLAEGAHERKQTSVIYAEVDAVPKFVEKTDELLRKTLASYHHDTYTNDPNVMPHLGRDREAAIIIAASEYLALNGIPHRIKINGMGKNGALDRWYFSIEIGGKLSPAQRETLMKTGLGRYAQGQFEKANGLTLGFSPYRLSRANSDGMYDITDHKHLLSWRGLVDLDSGGVTGRHEVEHGAEFSRIKRGDVKRGDHLGQQGRMKTTGLSLPTLRGDDSKINGYQRVVMLDEQARFSGDLRQNATMLKSLLSGQSKRALGKVKRPMSAEALFDETRTSAYYLVALNHRARHALKLYLKRFDEVEFAEPILEPHTGTTAWLEGKLKVDDSELSLSLPLIPLRADNRKWGARLDRVRTKKAIAKREREQFRKQLELNLEASRNQQAVGDASLDILAAMAKRKQEGALHDEIKRFAIALAAINNKAFTAFPGSPSYKGPITRKKLDAVYGEYMGGKPLPSRAEPNNAEEPEIEVISETGDAP